MSTVSYVIRLIFIVVAVSFVHSFFSSLYLWLSFFLSFAFVVLHLYRFSFCLTFVLLYIWKFLKNCFPSNLCFTIHFHWRDTWTIAPHKHWKRQDDKLLLTTTEWKKNKINRTNTTKNEQLESCLEWKTSTAVSAAMASTKQKANRRMKWNETRMMRNWIGEIIKSARVLVCLFVCFFVFACVCANKCIVLRRENHNKWPLDVI